MVMWFEAVNMCWIGLSVLFIQVGVGLASNDYSFWQITDIHWDFGYSRTGDERKMCIESGTRPTAKDNGYFGNYLCDSPFPLVTSAISAMAAFHPKVDFILWTGDLLPHRENLDQKMTFPILKNVTDTIVAHFPHTKVIPVFGNHEVVPKDQFPDHDAAFYKSYLSETGWDSVISPDGHATFLLGGYYSVEARKGLHVLVLNTILYKATNNLVSENETDPAGQFEWMTTKLQNARDKKEKVILTAHCPPGYSSLKDNVLKTKFNEWYIQLVLMYSDVILAQIYGHFHRDTFQLFADDLREVRSFSLIAPSVTPWGTAKIWNSNNPSVRRYDYNLGKAIITDYYEYMLNLSLANENFQNAVPNADQWKLLYRFTEEYKLPDVGLKSLFQLFNKLKVDNGTLVKFHANHNVDYDPGPCDATCKLTYVCTIGFTRANLMKECVRNETELKMGPSGSPSKATYATLLTNVRRAFTSAFWTLFLL